jgi:hypothetical protein
LQFLALSQLPLPEQSVLPFRKEVLKIANFCVATAFKGTPIAALTMDNVRVVRDESFKNYSARAANTLAHSSAQKISPAEMKNTVSAALMPLLPNRPIWVSESYLGQLLGIDPKLSDFALANTIIHELMHRLVQPKLIELTSDHPMLETVGLSSFRHQILAIPQGDARDQAIQHYEELHDRIKDSDPALLVEGAIAQLISADVNGTRGLQNGSGYDLNEGFAEFLAQEPKKVLEQQMKRALKPSYAAFLAETFRKNSGATIQRELYDMAKMAEVTRSLGLVKPNQVLKALRTSAVPELWMQHRPGELYP